MLVTWRYRKRRSIIQWFDPSAWIIFYTCFIVATIFFWDLRVLMIFLVVSFIVVFSSGVRWEESRRAWLFIGGFVIFYSILTFLTGRGGMELYEEEHILRTLEASFTIFGWRPKLIVTAERTMFALSQMARVFSLASMTILIPYSLNPSLYGITFKRLGLPDKIAYAMDLTMRFIPTYARDFQLTMDAQRARGYEIEKLSGGLFAQVRKLAPLLVPVTITAVAGAWDIIDAMDLRGFGVGKRTWLVELKYQRRDRILIAISIIILIVSMGASLFGIGQFWIPELLLQ